VGDGASPTLAPVQTASLDPRAVKIVAGGYHTCSRKANGSVWCWGSNGNGEVGDGTTDTPRPSPLQVTALGTSAEEIAVGKYHTCARKVDGSVWCWGRNDFGQVGDGTTASPKPSPVQTGLSCP
jgi:alpha-tubulin suppressor-like RCC1 family protein